MIKAWITTRTYYGDGKNYMDFFSSKRKALASAVSFANTVCDHEARHNAEWEFIDNCSPVWATVDSKRVVVAWIQQIGIR